MSQKVAVRNVRLKDKHGGIFNNAVVAIYAFSETSQISGKSEDCVKDYDLDHDITDISYTAMYKYDPNQTQMSWVKYEQVVDGEVVDKFKVDLSNPQVVAALQGVADTAERRARAIYADITRRAV